ncbi:LysR substrate-binding domain-containing protein [Burkholderia lata]|uniref:LysR substrate-binding domain-containing protein n=1 Tax=Burkholderia lata (strain ATCC 17760 / DSM 23089 / LMG 22485 / NCIMB 9086 / R18194 / 383) TaxID=482957 RepID=UPI0014532FE8|nr:LysR substrate-binding domain-containing protein [Burkholderia lata]VWM18702.1 LysR family transcriptional regulator [Burkholderia lata]
MRNLPPLSLLRAFEATARLGSVTKAAAELCRTHGAVSRQLKLLQEHFGAALFAKEGTGLKLNQHGEALFTLVAPMFEKLERDYERLRAQLHDTGLHVACSATFAMRWLVPNLADFYRMQPDVRIRLSMTSAREIRTEGADVVIVWDLTSYPQVDRERAVRLAPVCFGPVCTPEYASVAHTGIKITHDFTSSAWTNWELQNGTPIGMGGQIAFPHTHLCIEAALSGLGVALVERRLIQRELTKGLLVAPWGFTELPFGLMALTAPGRALPDKLPTFISWLCERLRADDSRLTSDLSN